MINDTNDIKVSVCVVTYNQEKYIAECLDSLVSQETDFKFEIIVGEDCSTDGTRAIVQQYVDKYPDIVKPIFHKQNVGAVENIKQVYIAAKGKYIAHMDGDDMACDEKLQAQFDILENRASCNVCSHDVMSIDSYGNTRRNHLVSPEGEYTLIDFYKNLSLFCHSSKMFRNKYSEQYWQNVLDKTDKLDIDLHIANLQDGNVYHIGKNLGKYRVSVGVSYIDTKVNSVLPLGNIRIYNDALKTFKDNEENLLLIKKAYALSMLQWAYNYAVHDKDNKLFREYVDRSISQYDIGLKQRIFKVGTYSTSLFFFVLKIRKRVRR